MSVSAESPRDRVSIDRTATGGAAPAVEPPPPRRFRLVPPVGFPLAGSEVLLAMRGLVGARRTYRRARRAIADYVGVRRAWLFGSGRAALTVALQAMARARPERREVVMPAYTCYSVASAVVRAGLTVRLADLLPGTTQIDPRSLDRVVGQDTLAVIATHLVGFPTDLRPFHELAAAAGAWLVDDAAQALGARHRGLALGGGGDVGILSFGRGKPLSTLGGGALLCDGPELIELIEPSAAGARATGQLAGARSILEAALYPGLLRPGVYWLPSQLPFLKVGVTEFHTDYPIRRLGTFKAGLLRAALDRLDRVNERRRSIAEHLARGLRGVHGIQLLEPPAEAQATYLRFPLLVAGEGERDRVVGVLRRAGFAAGRLYPRSLNRVDELAGASPDHGQSFPGAESLADRLVTLPTYPHVTMADVGAMCEALRFALRDAPPDGERATDAGT